MPVKVAENTNLHRELLNSIDMKKWLILLVVLLIIGLGCIYLFIPGKLTISEAAVINCSQKGAYRILTSAQTYPNWWSGKGRAFVIKKQLRNSLETEVRYEQLIIPGVIN